MKFTDQVQVTFCIRVHFKHDVIGNNSDILFWSWKCRIDRQFALYDIYSVLVLNVPCE
jgi:hypothetical protein